MLPQHLAGIVLENVINHNILYKFYVYFYFIIPSIYFDFPLCFIILFTLYSSFSQQMLLLFILLVLDGKKPIIIYLFI